MREFYEALLKRDPPELTPLEQVILWECGEEKDLPRLHEGDIRKEKDKNARRKADPTAERMVNTLREAAYRLFRKEVTGMTEYRIYCRDRLLGTARCQVGRDFPLVIHCDGNVFYSSFDKTIACGVTRDVIDTDAPSEKVAQLRWFAMREEQRLEIYSSGDPQSFRVWRHPAGYSSWNVYTFRDFSLKCRGEMLPLPQRQFLGEWELIYCAKLEAGFSDQTALLMMCYPLLRFAE